MALTGNLSAPAMWPLPPALPKPVFSDQRWLDAVFLHWRIPTATAAPFMPEGVEPDVFDGSSWVGLIGFRMEQAGLGTGPGIPYLGSFNEVNVRLYSRERDGTRGVVFLSLDADRLPVVMATRAAGIPYVWSRIRQWPPFPGGNARQHATGAAAIPRSTDKATVGYSVRRFGAAGARSHFGVIPDLHTAAADPLSIFLTARYGMHGRFHGRSIYVPNTHHEWPLFGAKVHRLSDGLVGAAGISVNGPPESVLYSPGVRTRFGRPRVLETNG
ncbi:YqjF family protein [Pseudarthrobacter sp. NPDC058119]|uniref:YqjF family protein n=1 Tax=Pseudarthrobacter sp. NPDC058119 TaxID=3346348 RepID=UPI0036D7B91A